MSTRATLSHFLLFAILLNSGWAADPTPKVLIIGIMVSIALQTVITFVPYFQPIFETEALTFSEFIIVGASASLIFIAVEIEKLIARRKSMLG